MKHPSTNSPFSDLMTVLSQLPSKDHESGAKICATLAKKPLGSLTAAMSGGISGGVGNDLIDQLVWLAEWQGKSQPALDESHICLLASSYSDGMSPDHLKGYMDLASQGQSYVNQLCKPTGLGLRILEMAVPLPHKAGQTPPSWSEADVMAAIAFGMEASASGGDLLGLGDLAYGNEKYAIAIICLLLGIETSEFAIEPGLRKAATDAQKLVHDFGAYAEEPFVLLQQLGGREMAGCIGGILAARSRQLPVVLDGWAPSVAALILYTLDPDAVNHVVLAAPLNDAHRRAMSKVGLRPIVNIAHNAGMGVGAAMAMNVLKSALTVFDVPDGI